MGLIIYLVVYGIYGTIWGVVTNKVIENKGYRENWFWWGFFFGFFALIIAATKPALPRETSNTGSYFGDGGSIVGPEYRFTGFGIERKVSEVPNGWRCNHCGAVNAGYVGTCGCGCDKSGNMPMKAPAQAKQDGTEDTSQMMFCTSCGKQVETDAKFCRYCGNKISM